LQTSQDALPSPEIKSWTLESAIYTPVTTLTWKTDDQVSRNLHLAVVAPYYADPGSQAVVDANAWVDIAGKSGRMTRHAISDEIGRLKNLTPETVGLRVADLQVLLWQAYASIHRVDRAALESQRAERVPHDADPGPIRLEVWFDE
jgi:hypothetical protein